MKFRYAFQISILAFSDCTRSTFVLTLPLLIRLHGITEMNVAVPPPPPPHLRLYEFAKTALIKIFAFPYATVRYIAPLFHGFQFVANQRESWQQNPETSIAFAGCQMCKVCDLYCDGGVDTDKWCDAQVGHYIGIGTLPPLA
jgi:hypothetical protein